MTAAQIDPTDKALAPSFDGVLIMEWWGEDRHLSVEYTDGMIRSWPATMDDAINAASEVFGPDRRPGTKPGADVLRWTHFNEGA